MYTYAIGNKLNYNDESPEKQAHIDNLINIIHERMRESGCQFNEDPYNEKNVSLFFSIGGDGTMLHSIGKNITSHFENSPIFVGVNAGNVGFLTPYEASNVLDGSLFDDIFSEDSRIEKRSLIRYDLSDGTNFTAVNELAINPTKINDMVNFSMFVDHIGDGTFRPSGHYSANTLLLSTPMGSTAYNKNAGGAIIDPNTSSIQFTLIAPTLLGNRPVVFNNNAKIKIVANNTIDIWNDGQQTTRLEKGDFIIVSVKEIAARILLPKDWNYFSFLSKKLYWNNGQDI